MKRDKISETVKWESHPRYGDRPIITGLNPVDFKDGAILSWHGDESRIPNTAIRANLKKQVRATVQWTHYFDEARTCRECGKPFIFFAKEQAYWHETLQITLDADCVRCVACRRSLRAIARIRSFYESMLAREDRSPTDDLKLAAVGLKLIEEGIFGSRAIEKVRAILNLHENKLQGKNLEEWKRLKERASSI